MNEKERVRARFLAARQALPRRAAREAQIADHLLHCPAYRRARVIALYKNLPAEVSTAAVLAEILRQGKTAALPRVAGAGLEFYAVLPGEALARGAFGVEEPAARAERRVEPAAMDLIIVPGVAFDLKKNRLGFGKGFYDRFLQGCAAPKIGLCFEAQLLREGRLPCDAHDIPMDYLITEAGLY